MPYDSPDTTGRKSRLTTNVKLHPDLQAMVEKGEHVFLHGSLEVKVDVGVDRDFNQGEKLLVTIADADGQVVNRAVCEVKPVTFEPLEEATIGVYGTLRRHKAVPTGEVVQDVLEGWEATGT